MTRPLRVAVVARSVAPLHGVGGLERSVRDLVNYLSTHGVEVTLITRTPRTDGVESCPQTFAGTHAHAPAAHGSGADSGESAERGRVPSREAAPPVRTVFVPYRTFPFAGRRGTTVIDRSTAYPLFGMRAGRVAWDLVRGGQVDLVHGFGASVLGYARRRREGGAPLVLNPQGLEEFGATNPSGARLKRALYLPLRMAVRACAAAADCVIATDRVLEPAVRAHLDVPRERVRVIPNGLDLAWIDGLIGGEPAPDVRRRAGIAPDVPVLLSVGRLEQNKGFHVLTAALAALLDHGTASHVPWKWVIVGDGPYRARLERAIAAAGLTPRTVLAGRAADRDLHAWYETAALFVHPTLYEGSSLVTLEAMAHRRAVVATRAGGIPDKVRPGINGWLVPPGDPGALAGALSGALGDPARAAAMGQAGRAIVEEEFSWQAIGKSTLQMYTELLGHR